MWLKEVAGTLYRCPSIYSKYLQWGGAPPPPSGGEFLFLSFCNHCKNAASYPGSLSSITVMVMVIWTTESGASGVAARVHVVYYSRHGMHGYCARQYICVAHHLLFSQGSLVSQIRNQSSSTSSSAHRGVSAISPCSPLAARPLASPNPAAGQESWPGAVHIDHTHCSCPLGGAIMSS